MRLRRTFIAANRNCSCLWLADSEDIDRSLLLVVSIRRQIGSIVDRLSIDQVLYISSIIK